MTTKAVAELRQWLDAWERFGTPKAHCVSVRAGRGDVTLDTLRAVLAAAEENADLKRRIRLARELVRRPHTAMAPGTVKHWWLDELDAALDLRKPLKAGRTEARSTPESSLVAWGAHLTKHKTNARR